MEERFQQSDPWYSCEDNLEAAIKVGYLPISLNDLEHV
jgi:hypothetical protein